MTILGMEESLIECLIVQFKQTHNDVTLLRPSKRELLAEFWLDLSNLTIHLCFANPYIYKGILALLFDNLLVRLHVFGIALYGLTLDIRPEERDHFVDNL